MRIKALILIAVSMTGASCTLFGRMQPQGRPVMDVAAAPSLVVEQASPLRMAKTTPVLSPPEVFAVYVTSHVDRRRDLMIGEHWVFFKLGDSSWFSERRAAPAPPASGAAPAALV